MMNELRLSRIEKYYNRSADNKSESFVLGPIDLSIREGEFFSLLGPSGCGKTTLLKLAAGLLEADSGEVRYGDSNLTAVPPEARRFSMVFQQPLLFPHMTVAENTAFGLKMQGVGKKERLAKAEDMLDHVGLKGFHNRFPDELSGGQQQRVALARALVANPRVLLMDEPFSALDPSLRGEMRKLLGTIQKDLNVTVLFVTHDREEAFELSDRIGIMSDGRLLQVGMDKELYEKPASTKIAAFLGMKNIIPGKISNGRFVSADQAITMDAENAGHEGDSFLILRPEALQAAEENNRAPTDSIRISGLVQKLKFLQGFHTATIKAGDHELECLLFSKQSEEMEAGQRVELFFKQSDAWFVAE